MASEHTPFTPEEVDDQIDRTSPALHAPPTAAPAQQLAGELRALYSAESAELTRAVERGRERLAQSDAARRAPQPPALAATPPRSAPARRISLKHPLALFSPQQRLSYRLGSLVAAVLLVALVGGLVAGLVLVRQGAIGVPGSSGPQSLKGGVEVLLQPACASHCTSHDLTLMAAVSAILKGRIKDGLGVSQPIVRQQGNNQILVDLPALPNTPDAVALLTRTGKLEFIDTGQNGLSVGTVVQPGQYPVRFTGQQLDPNSIQPIDDPQSGQAVILFEFRASARAAFAAYTQQNIGNYLTVTLDNTVIESAVIQSAITDQGEIASNMTPDQARQTAALLRYGALPLPLTIAGERSITT